MGRQRATQSRKTGKRKRKEEPPAVGEEGSGNEGVWGVEEAGKKELVLSSRDEEEEEEEMSPTDQEVEGGRGKEVGEDEESNRDYEEEGPEQVLLVRGKDTALEQRRLEKAAVKRSVSPLPDTPQAPPQAEGSGDHTLYIWFWQILKKDHTH